jgi:hypothetical protein
MSRVCIRYVSCNLKSIIINYLSILIDIEYLIDKITNLTVINLFKNKEN